MGGGIVVDAWNNAMQLAVQNYVIAEHAERARELLERPRPCHACARGSRRLRRGFPAANAAKLLSPVRFSRSHFAGALALDSLGARLGLQPVAGFFTVIRLASRRPSS